MLLGPYETPISATWSLNLHIRVSSGIADDEIWLISIGWAILSTCLVSGRYFLVGVGINMWYKNLHTLYFSHIEYTFLYPDLFVSVFPVLFIPGLQLDSHAIAHDPEIYVCS